MAKDFIGFTIELLRNSKDDRMLFLGRLGISIYIIQSKIFEKIWQNYTKFGNAKLRFKMGISKISFKSKARIIFSPILFQQSQLYYLLYVILFIFWNTKKSSKTFFFSLKLHQETWFPNISICNLLHLFLGELFHIKFLGVYFLNKSELGQINFKSLTAHYLSG